MPAPVSKKVPLSPLQLLILGLMGLILCVIAGGAVGLLVMNREAFLPNVPAPSVAQNPPSAVPSSTPTPEPMATATPFPTVALPEPLDPPAPTPTATYVVAPADINKQKIREITGFVEQWRNLSLPEPLPIEFLTRRQLAEQWQEESYDTTTLEAVRTQQEFYRALGLIGPDVDLAKAALQAATTHVMGYYTPEEKIMYIIADSVNMFAEEEMTFAHEYTHALQDHYFGLGDYLKQAESADARLAARSLPEGDARLVEDLFTMQNISRDQLDYTVYRYLFKEHPILEGVSPALGVFTYFPYTAGEYFSIYMFIEGGFTWDKVNQAYRHPPLSTEQVMHPEKYLTGEKPVVVNIPDMQPALGGSWRELTRDVLGEAGFLVWLLDQVDDQTAIDAAAGWGGDAYSLWVNDAGQRLLVELSVWDTETEANEFFEAFATYMDLREGEAARRAAAEGLAWDYQTGGTRLSRSGKSVQIIVAPHSTVLESVFTHLERH
jgi:hypothetical protein